MTSGTPTMTATVMESLAPRRTARRLRRTPPVSRRAAMSIAIAPVYVSSRAEDRLLLPLDVLDEAVDVVRIVDELLEGRDHHRRGEVRSRVAVEELRDVLGRIDQREALLLKVVVAAGLGSLVGCDVVRVALEIGVLRDRAAQVLEQHPCAVLVLRVP